jgi:hypothetical protein
LGRGDGDRRGRLAEHANALIAQFSQFQRLG